MDRRGKRSKQSKSPRQDQGEFENIELQMSPKTFFDNLLQDEASKSKSSEENDDNDEQRELSTSDFEDDVCGDPTEMDIILKKIFKEQLQEENLDEAGKSERLKKRNATLRSIKNEVRRCLGWNSFPNGFQMYWEIKLLLILNSLE